MLDVHAPEHGIHGVRDFFVHLLTISVGLLIALGLEASVEALHHRGERKEAEATLRQELTQNRLTLVAIQRDSDRERDGLVKILKLLEDLRDGRQGDPSILNMDFNVEPLQSAAWHTASATGALSYMSYEEVQRFSAAYQEQQLFEEAMSRAFGHVELIGTYSGLVAHNLRAMKPQDTESAIGDVRQVMADVRDMSDITRATLPLYDAALKQ
jgi:hypothetical protein